MPRPTVHDIAKAAGVSLATVDRVINERPGVRPATIVKVHDAIRELGYIRDVAAANLARQRNYRLTFILPEPTNAFLGMVHDAIGAAGSAAAIDRTLIEIRSVPARDPHAIARTLADIAPDEVDGVAIMADETPQVRDALSRLRRGGVAAVAFISDLPSSDRQHFIGIDNVAAGRTAGLLMGRFLGERPGSILVVAGSMMARDHIERRLGFDQVMAESFPHLQTLPSLEGWDDAKTVRELVPRALANQSNVVGIYSIGGGDMGLIDALADHGSAGEFVVIAHELTPHAHQALVAGTLDAVIAQDVGHVTRSVIRVLRALTDGQDIVPAQERIRIEVIVKENID